MRGEGKRREGEGDGYQGTWEDVGGRRLCQDCGNKVLFAELLFTVFVYLKTFERRRDLVL